jgi:hypothetical protein
MDVALLEELFNNGNIPVKKLLLASLATLFVSATASAGTITDQYWGGDAHSYGDVIGTSMYDVSSATLKMTGTVLTISIATNFAGHAGADTWAAAGGIAYGDIFLAPSWTPHGSDAKHASDNANNGTKWTFGLSLDNRWNNNGGSFSLYELNGATNASNIRNSESFMSCGLGSQCWYRNGQETAVKTNSATVRNTGLTGAWTVNPNNSLNFSIDVAGTALAGYSNMAFHWGETCQNDVIEGVTKVPEPGSLALIGLALAGLAVRRRSK